jgi:CelD/BcsL family acetyltransferase involved in cellulose biosynthesis
VTTLAPTGEPACSGPTDAPRPTSEIDPAPAPRALRAARVDFDAIPREAWDRLAAANPWATPFSSWAFQRAWWDAYGGTAHDQTLVVCEPLTDANPNPTDDPIAIVPLMHRHEVEPTDAESATKIRHGDQVPNLTPVPATAKAVFFGASYHADYATILAAPEHLPAVAAAVVDHLAGEGMLLDPGHPEPWDVVDLRRLRCGDPTADALAAAFGAREIQEGWTLDLEREDVCPVVTFPEGATFEDYLGTLDKKARHEIRRKLRRAEAAGEVRLAESPSPLDDLDDFIDLHQRRWGEDGLFPPTPGGDASRVFLRRVFEESGPDGAIRLSFLTVGDRRIASGIHVRTPDTWMFYNAGIDPDAKELSPGVILAACYVRAAMEAGAKRFDFLRGDESYKYEWGSVDEPIQRLLVRRDGTGNDARDDAGDDARNGAHG